MGSTKYLKGECQTCGGHLEFPAEVAGLTADCPHCGKQTDLLLATPKEEPVVSSRAVVWLVITAIILVLGAGGLWYAWQKAQKWAAQKQTARASQSTNETAAPVTGSNVAAAPGAPGGFVTSDVKLEKTPGSSLIYAVGNVKNALDKQRFGVRVELELLDAAGKKLGTAKDYQQVLEPKAEWQFKALVVDKSAASARLLSVKEEQ